MEEHTKKDLPEKTEIESSVEVEKDEIENQIKKISKIDLEKKENEENKVEDEENDPCESENKDSLRNGVSSNVIDSSENLNSSNVSSVVTVFHNSKNFTVKHPLMHKWTLWFTKPLTPGQRANTTDAWADSLKEVITFDSVEEFWGIYNNIAKASQLPPKSDYHLFKTGVRPEWEDKQNQRGGRWSYNNRDRRSVNIDELWLHIMLAAIGETLENEGDNEVMGVVVNIRKGFVRLGLWTRSTSNEEVLRAIGKRFREAMKIPDKEMIEFYSHSDSAHSGSTRAKSKMYA
ncbi:hypothetical protein PNEG_03112 [Pneumocystis murina B123]|uniref:Eukaryotic translation initiation factor 4E n=1 Tax=Pneumocystis murina (strain B123) TaxID=1069680 RepID=M7NNE2_PNEMU|nr:hypothetical protein PNEG_03112 [Pneumocystis murina B123]EMR08636.1 hypothetical protein PNEG_03112 [Pneumocystis murina B123]